MKRHRLASVACVLLGLMACGDQPTEPPASGLGARRALLERAVSLRDDVRRVGVATTAHRAEGEGLVADIQAWNRLRPHESIGLEGGVASPTDQLTLAAVPIFPKPGCAPCPFIIFRGNRIGILRSEGPCRPGAGLERCFYTWIYVGQFGG